ncbi:MAG: glycosyltransferase family 2 protein [Chloroflexi bacterium]|nr:glycosyltransferase family 2 protein [Chloroflexota bacterium]
MTPFLTVFVPARNEQANLEGCVTAVLTQMAAMDVSSEILIVDDGSQDGTFRLAQALAQTYPNVRCVCHERNLGVGRAFLTALAHARGEWMILIPADLALDPRDLSLYLRASAQADIVVGLRSDRRDSSLLRRVISRSNIFLIQRLFHMPLRQFQYISMYRLDVLRQIRIEYPHSAFFLPEVLIRARDQGFRLVEVEIRYAPRLRGKPSGAKLALILFTLRDMFAFWLGYRKSRRKP